MRQAGRKISRGVAMGASFQLTSASHGTAARADRVGADLPHRPRSRTDGLRSLHARIGNRATAALLAKQRSVGSPDSPREREADAFADSVLGSSTTSTPVGASSPAGPSCACEDGGTPCDSCATKAKAGDRARPNGGHRLDRTAESAINVAGVHAGHVRVHTGDDAARAADDLDARAFTIGSDVSFAAGAYQPGTTSGLRLIAHEVAHTLQHAQADDGQVNRVPNDAGAKVPDKQADAGPCAVDAAALSNDGLLFHLNRARLYLADHTWGEDDTYDWANLLRRLSTARRERTAGGDAWLAQRGLAGTPPLLYSLEPSGLMGIAVRPADVGEAANRTQPTGTLILTPDQFDAFLDLSGIPHVDARDYFARRDPNIDDPLNLTLHARRALLPDFVATSAFPFTSSRSNVYGANTVGAPFNLGPPYGEQTPSGLSVPGWQWATVPQDATSALRDVAASPSSVTAEGPERLVRPAAPNAGLGPRAWISPYGFRMVSTPPPVSPTGTGVDFSAITPTGPSFADLADPSLALSMSGKPVRYRSQAQAAQGAFQTGLLDPSSGRLGLHTHGVAPSIRDQFGVTGRQLESAHVLPDDVLETLGLSGDSGFAALAPKEVNSAIDRQWKAAWKRAKANGDQLTVADLHDIVFRSFAAAPDAMVNPRFKGTLAFALEYQIYSHLGLTPNQVVLSGTPRPAGPAPAPVVEPGPPVGPDGRVIVDPVTPGGMRPGRKAGLFGAGMMFAGDLWSGAHGAHPNYAADLAIGYASGEAQAFVESAAAPWMTRGLASAGFSDAAAGLGGKVAGSTGAAFVIAPAVTGLQMWFSDEKYTTVDYEAKMSRSAVAGGGGALAGALAAGGYGALAGSEAPVVGNAIGFIVGFGGYLLTDWLVGDDVEEAVRKLAGEQGCTGGVGPGK
jgi:Domain of unknown function (DUF4157)